MIMLNFIHVDASYNPHHLALIVYHFPPNILPVAQKHGNAKSEIPFFPTSSSTIKSECLTSGPKQVVSNVFEKVGGLLSASYPGILPRNERQIKYAKHAAKSDEYNPADELYSVMFRAKQESNAFVRDIKVLPEPVIVLASEYQLDDLVRFATCDTNCVLTIDPTFSLGKFDVTPITYRHLLLESRRSGKPPVCVGPIFVHYKKTFSSYLFFASSLVGLRKELLNVKAFGTDGEEALADAFSHEFGKAVHLTCVIHKQRNIKAKLKDVARCYY